MEKVVVQSLWTKPFNDKAKLRDTLYMAALSLAFAQRSGYKVHMHTDDYGYELLKDFGYDKIVKTLNKIPYRVPFELFAAGKFFALREEGVLGVVHADTDVFLKKPCIDKFFTNKDIDVICQQEESTEVYLPDHKERSCNIHTIGYPASTRPDWQGSMNTGVIGFNNSSLAEKYMNNYFEALGMYTKDVFEEYKQKHPNCNLLFDFILEQKTLSYMSVGYNVMTLIPMYNFNSVANEIGYAHFQGLTKWQEKNIQAVKNRLNSLDGTLFNITTKASESI